MGIPGLWEAVSKAGQSRSLAHLAVVDGFEGNKSGKRAYRVGIDASIWYHHASFSKGGDNPELRCLFFRLRSLAELPILPLFVFDGRERPKVKRGSKMGKSGSHNLTQGLKSLLDIFGMEWRMALGEAEAELAYLNRCGVIDAVMTDDVDTLVFGAQTIIKNPSIKLSGNKSNPALNSAGKASKHHVMVYNAQAILDHPEIRLSQAGMILIALLAGGDYDKGVEKCGKDIAYAMARCGFGEQLLALFQRRSQEDVRPFLAHWRAGINQELHTNSRGFLRHRYPSLSLPPDFPNMQILENYANPVCSGRIGRQGGGPMRGIGEMNIAKIAGFCEQKFGEWGHRSAIIHRFRTLIWEAAVMRILRRAALAADEKERDKRLANGKQDWAILHALQPSPADGVGTTASLVKQWLNPSDEERRRAAFANHASSGHNVQESDPNPLIVKIVKSRQHITTDHMLEYQVEICPIQLVSFANSGIKGTRPEPSMAVGALMADRIASLMDDFDPEPPSKTKKPPPLPSSSLTMWVPASMMRHVHPRLVEEFKIAEETKKSGQRKGKGKTRASARDDDDHDDRAMGPSSLVRTSPLPRRSSNKKPREEEDNQAPQQVHHTSASSIADPWFSSDATLQRSSSTSSDTLSSYFFCSENPDDPSALDFAQDTGPNRDDLGNADHDQDEEDLEDAPRDRFDDMFDQIMGISASFSRPKKKTPAPKKRSRPQIVDSGTGTQLESNSARTAKRAKTMHTAPSPFPDLSPLRPPAPPSLAAKPQSSSNGIIDLSDFEDMSSGLSKRKPSKFATSTAKRTEGRRYLVPSSSQGLFLSDANVILDLT